eukprot:1203581-Pleurochrysis_carterae.AAC.1
MSYKRAPIIYSPHRRKACIPECRAPCALARALARTFSRTIRRGVNVVHEGDHPKEHTARK